MKQEARIAAWIAVAGALFWVVIFDGFLAGALVILTLVATFLAAFFAWLEGQP